MNEKFKKLVENLKTNHTLTVAEYLFLLENFNSDTAEYLQKTADAVRRKVYGNKVYIRGLIEISNICKNDCYYCGIRRSNNNCERYRLTEQQILNACDTGYSLGFRTFVLQGGEDGHFTDDVVCNIISKIKQSYPDCAVTISLGERSFDSYKRLFDAGADRYLLRHETASAEHYSKLHPKELTLQSRIECLKNLREIGYQVGCGFMVGAPYQTNEDIAKDLKFIEEFKPDMCGIGPFIPHKDTPFKDFSSGTADFTCYILSIIRLIHERVLLPATTALGTISKQGREKGIKSGANVVMPNLSPESVRSKYELYNNKLHTDCESAQSLQKLKSSMQSIGYEIVVDRGDISTERED